MSANPSNARDNTAAIAAQFGVSLKALRHYERLGLLKPPRTKSGWRSYGKAEIDRLHIVLSLKQLGLPLARIAALLKGGKTDLGAVLAVQEQLLRESRVKADHALTLIKIARTRLDEKGELTTDELAELVRHFERSLIRWSPELDELATRVYTPEQIAKYMEQQVDCEQAAEQGQGWAAFYADLEPVMARGDPLSEEAFALARRMAALINMQTRGDQELWNRASRFWREAVNDPKIAPNLPMKKAHYDFIGITLQELRRRGELKP